MIQWGINKCVLFCYFERPIKYLDFFKHINCKRSGCFVGESLCFFINHFLTVRHEVSLVLATKIIWRIGRLHSDSDALNFGCSFYLIFNPVMVFLFHCANFEVRQNSVRLGVRTLESWTHGFGIESLKNNRFQKYYWPI